MIKSLFTIAALGAVIAPAFATDLWNQENMFHTVGGSGEVNNVFSDFATYSTYMASDVVVGAGGWTVTSIQEEVIASDPTNVTGITSGVLNVFSNAGSLPTSANDPSTGTSVSVSLTQDTNFSSGVYFVTATGLNLHLNAGEYWIGLTPSDSYAVNGETYEGFTSTNAAGANYGDAIRNPGGSFGLPAGSGWGSLEVATSSSSAQYGAIDIQGTAVPEPTTMAAFGLGLVGLVARKRRK